MVREPLADGVKVKHWPTVLCPQLESVCRLGGEVQLIDRAGTPHLPKKTRLLYMDLHWARPCVIDFNVHLCSPRALLLEFTI